MIPLTSSIPHYTAETLKCSWGPTAACNTAHRVHGFSYKGWLPPARVFLLTPPLRLKCSPTCTRKHRAAPSSDFKDLSMAHQTCRLRPGKLVLPCQGPGERSSVLSRWKSWLNSPCEIGQNKLVCVLPQLVPHVMSKSESLSRNRFVFLRFPPKSKSWHYTLFLLKPGF